MGESQRANASQRTGLDLEAATSTLHHRRSCTHPNANLHHLPATMKLSWGFVASSLYCAAAAATTGHVFTFDASNDHAAPASSPIDPETARLILAQRLGLSRFHSIKDADAEAIKSINTYGGRQQKLFGEQADTSRAQLLVWLQDAEQSLVTSGSPCCAARSWRLTNV